MVDFFTAIGLMIFLEGLLYGGFPNSMRSVAQQVAQMSDSELRKVGVCAMIIGVFIVWMIKG